MVRDRPPDREDATAAISVMSAERGAWCVRVHDVRRSLDAILVAHRWTGERELRWPPSDLDDVLAAHAAFYEAFERADFDAMQELWADDEGVVCVHPATEPIRGRRDVMRSWMVLMANSPYIQFFLTDIEGVVVGDVASVTCTENVLVGQLRHAAGRIRRRACHGDQCLPAYVGRLAPVGASRLTGTVEPK